MQALYRVLAILFILAGSVMVFGARVFVDRFQLQLKSTIDFEHQMDQEEMEQYKMTKAVVNFKMLGLLAALPGFIFIILGFRQ